MKLTANGRKRLQLLTTILLVVTIVAIIYTLVAWIVSEPGSFEPLSVLAFAVLSLLTAVSAWLSRAENVAPPENSAVAEAETIPLGPLRQQIADSFDLDELRTLCLDIGILYEDLSGDTISAKSASLVATMQRRGQLAKLTAVLQRERPHITWFLPAQLEQQYGLRRNVRAAWIDGVLKQSVTDEIALELKLTYQPQALTRKTLYVPGQVDRPVEKDVPALFAESGSLLILGEPGSGKTMTLLQLAERLLDAAEADPAQPTPVVLNLSSWAVEKKALPDWMVEELLLQYQLPRETSRRLIASGGLIYLLDGLDEVAAAARDACVQAINDLKAQQPASLAVCCRVAEYEGLAAKLNLGTAVRIQPLSDEQIDDYLRRPELKLTAVRQMVKTDAAMQELAQTPLFLSVMTLAYRDMKRADLKQLPTPEARRAHLYDHYVAEMWRRRPLTSNEPYNETQAMTWLANLAHGMTQAEQTTFYMERLQPTWLPTLSMSRRYTQVNGALVGLSSGLLFGLILGSLLGLWSIALESSNVGLDILIIWWLLGLFFGSYLGWKVGRKEAEDSAYKPIELIEKLVWSAPPFKRFLKQFLKESKDLLIGGALGGLLIGLIVESMLKRLSGANAEPNEVASLFGWAGFGVFLGAIVRLYEGLRIIVQTQDSRRISQPNQGIYDSGFNAWRMGSIYALVYGLIFGSTIGLISMAPSRLINGLVFGLIIGLIAGLIGGLDYGGKTFMRHYVLRWLLARQGVLPFPFKDRLLIVYLDTMADRIFLRRVGGGWVFIHRTLLDYFASLHPDATPATTVILNPAGVKNPNDPE